MPRASRRDEILRVALGLFADHGYEGTSIADIAGAVGVSKAAISYHFPAKDDLLDALADPPLTALELLVAQWGSTDTVEVPDVGALRPFLTAYARVLLAHADVATWLDADRGVLAHNVIGARIDALHAATRRVLGGGDQGVGDIAAASALGVLWRPIRNLDTSGDEVLDLLVAAAVAAISATTG